VRLLGQELMFSYDGTIYWTLLLPDGRLTHGRIGVEGGTGTNHVLWDDIVVRSYVAPEPEVFPGPAEARCP